MSHLGDFVITAGHDRAIRVFLRSNEPVILEEEREKELEDQMDQNMDVEGDRALGMEEGTSAPDAAKQATGEGHEVTVESKEGSDKVGSVYSGSMRAADALISALERAEAQRKKVKEWEEECEYMKSLLTEEEFNQRTENGAKPLIPPPDKDVYMLGMSPYEYVASTVR